MLRLDHLPCLPLIYDNHKGGSLKKTCVNLYMVNIVIHHLLFLECKRVGFFGLLYIFCSYLCRKNSEFNRTA